MKVFYRFDGEGCWYEANLEERNKCWEKILKDYTREDLIELCPELKGEIEVDFESYEMHQLVDYVKENGEGWFKEEIHEYFEEDARDWYKDACLLRENPYNQSDFI